MQDHSITLLFVNAGEVEDTSPSLDKVQYIAEQNRYLVRSIRGLRIQATRRLDDTGGFDVSRIGPYRLSSSTTVAISDPAVLLALKPQAFFQNESDTFIQLAFSAESAHPSFSINAAMASFGQHIYDTKLESVHLVDLTSNADNGYGCLPFIASNSVALVQRGNCTFASKMKTASEAGALAVLVLSDEDELLVPSAEGFELASIQKPIPLLLVPRTAAEQLQAALSAGPPLRMQVVSSTAEAKRAAWADELARTPVIVNGHWLFNCRLVQP